MTPIRIDVGGSVIAAELLDTATASDLAALLPLAVTLTDFHEQEKLGTLPRPLTLEGAPRSAGADPGDIGYYAPSNHLVLYYAAVGRFPGIVPIGRFDPGAVDRIRALQDGADATLAPT